MGRGGGERVEHNDVTLNVFCAFNLLAPLLHLLLLILACVHVYFCLCVCVCVCVCVHMFE